MKLQEIILSELHYQKGKQVILSYPQKSLLTSQQFKLYAQLLLPQEQLCSHILSIQFNEEYTLLGLPTISKNHEHDDTYHREIYIYALYILIKKAQFLNQIKQYKEFVLKVSNFFKSAEENYHILYHHPDHQQYLNKVLRYFHITNRYIYTEINSNQVCNLTYFCTNYMFINLKESPIKSNHYQYNLSSVPITTLSFDQIEKIQNPFAKSLLKVAFYGNSTIHKIIKENSEYKETLIKDFYIKAIEKGIVFLISLFSFNNVYVLTDCILKCLPDEEHSWKIEQIFKNVLKSKENVENIQKEKILEIFFEFNRVTSIAKIIERNIKLMKLINFQKFIKYGEMYGLIHRVYQKVGYSQLANPLIITENLKIYLQTKHSSIDISPAILNEEKQKLTAQLKTHLLKNDTIDEISTCLSIQSSTLLKIMSPQHRYLLQVSLKGKLK